MKLGCIGDDFTGSSDLANTLAKQGMRVVQYPGVPAQAADDKVEAGIVSLKTRSVPVADAIAQSLNALEWLQSQGCTQFFFKYCSTFDSTKEGNIGPVAEALAEKLGAKQVIVCPAFPGTGRTVFQGHLFVNDVLLNESGMQNHPLTPMVDADIRRWLGFQSDGQVGHVGSADVVEGAEQIKTALKREQDKGCNLVVVDAIHDADLMTIGKAAKDLLLITGGSGVALGLPANFGAKPAQPNWQSQPGKSAILSGSCSTATRAQVARHGETYPVKEILPNEVMDKSITPKEIAQWMLDQKELPLLSSSADPETVSAAQEKYGTEAVSSALENFFAAIARELVEQGVSRLICAGGETSSAIVESLGLSTLEIGPEIDPGVPALRASDDLVITLKSGNFGSEDFFAKADKVLAG